MKRETPPTHRLLRGRRAFGFTNVTVASAIIVLAAKPCRCHWLAIAYLN
jgi:hypothetical protein